MSIRKLISYILILLLIDNAYSTEGQMSNEFTNYTYVGNGDYVNRFTGQFNYSIPVITIPGPGGSGYEMALTYNSGSGPDTESSWVGHGWQLSPGAINRQVNGIPDDFNDITIKNYQKFRPIYDASKTIDLNLEYNSKDKKDSDFIDKIIPKGGNLALTAKYNNLNNYSTNLNVSAIATYGSLGLDFSNNMEVGVRFTANLSSLLSEYKGDDKETASKEAEKGKVSFSEVISKDFSYGSIFNNTVSQSRIALSYSNLATFPSTEIDSEIEVKSFSTKFGLQHLGVSFETSALFPELSVTSIKPKHTNAKNITSFGSMYMGYADDNSLKDFQLIYDYKFNLKDKLLKFPVGTKDNYIVNVQGLDGVFEVRSYTNGNSFRKEKSESLTRTTGGGLALRVLTTPFSLVVGGDFRKGYFEDDRNEISYNNEVSLKYQHDDNINRLGGSQYDEIYPSIYFAFKNDIGSDDAFVDNNNIDFKLNKSKGIEDYRNERLNSNEVEDGISYISGSKNIDFLRFKDINTKRTEYFHKPIYDKLKNKINVNPYQIASYFITNENGQKFEFGQPVFTRNTINLSYGITKMKHPEYNGELNSEVFSTTSDNYRVYHSINPKHDKNVEDEEDDAPKVIMGQHIEEPYVTSYLLTNIYSNDYIDLTNNGPSVDDIGSYTEFNYTKTAGSENILKNDSIDWDDITSTSNTYSDWFKYRTPYNGFNYSRGENYDPLDDMISYSSGEKELYYLNTISTKTHIAVFITNQSSTSFTYAKTGEVFELNGSNNNRKDNFEAIYNEYLAGSSSTVTSANSGTINKQKYLERIELWTLDTENPKDSEGRYRLKEHLKTVKFEYDYSIWPNQISSLDSVGKRYGKLTLKRMWTEYGSVKEKENSPYEFSYVDNTESYEIYNGNEIINYNNPTPAREDEPDYNYLDINSWGDYEPDNLGGNVKKKFSINSLNQSSSNTFNLGGVNKTYDPSAWQLKRITLPSQGQIHIDYERNEYAFVQDRPSMVLAYIKPGSYDASTKSVILDINKTLGADISSNSDLLNEINNLINDELKGTDRLTNRKKFYFKFLYELLTGEHKDKNVSIERENSNYIEGWVKISSSVIEGNDIKITFEEEEFLPKKLCNQFYNNKANKLSYDLSDYNHITDVTINNNAYSKNYKSDEDFKRNNINNFLNTEHILNAFAFRGLTGEKICGEIREDLSFLRIPIPSNIPKKGGGLRVKRMLFVDDFDEITKGHSKRIYGKEYIYNSKEGESYGVASNEPGLLREENPLYIPFDRTKNPGNEFNGSLSTLISAEYKFVIDDLEQFAGIVGEKLNYIQGVGYSKTIVKDIFNNSTHSGFEINKYHTTKDYPFYRDIDKDIPTFQHNNIGIVHDQYNFLLVNFDIAKAKQNYQIIRHDLNGKLKEQSKYGGNYDSLESNWSLSYKQEIEYFNYNEKIPLLNKDFKIKESNPGLNVELYNYNEKQEQYGISASPEFDIYLNLWSFIPYKFTSNVYSYTPPVSYVKKKLNLESSTRIIDIPVFPKRIKTYVDGVKNIEENIAFNMYTGAPIIKRVNNKFGNESENSEMYDVVDIPASYIYEELSQKMKGKVGNVHLPVVNYKNNPEYDEFQPSSGLKRKKIKVGEDDIYTLTFDSFWDNSLRGDVINNFAEGSIIRVTNEHSNLYSSYNDEYYTVISKLNDVLYLKPYLHKSIGIEDDLEYGEQLVFVDIIESGYKNMLNLNIGQVIKKSSDDNKIFTNIGYTNQNIDSTKAWKQELTDSLNSKIKWIANSLHLYKSSIDDGTFTLNELNSDINLVNPILDNKVDVLKNYYGATTHGVNEATKVKWSDGSNKELLLNELYNSNTFSIQNFEVRGTPYGDIEDMSDSLLSVSFEVVLKREDEYSITPSSTLSQLGNDIQTLFENVANLNLLTLIKNKDVNLYYKRETIVQISENTYVTVYIDDFTNNDYNTLDNYIREESGFNDIKNNVYLFKDSVKNFSYFFELDFELKDKSSLKYVIANEDTLGIYLNNFKLKFKENSNFNPHYPNSFQLDYDDDRLDVKYVESPTEVFLLQKENYSHFDKYIFKNNPLLEVISNQIQIPNTSKVFNYLINPVDIGNNECRKVINWDIPRDKVFPYNHYKVDLTGTLFPSTSSNTHLNDTDLFKLSYGEIEIPINRFFYLNSQDELVNKTLHNGIAENGNICLDFYEKYDDIYYVDNVLSVQASELSNTWSGYDISSSTFLNSDNEYLNGKLGRWNLKSNHSYRNNIVDSKDYYSNNNIYDNSSFLEFDGSTNAISGSSLTFNLLEDVQIKPKFVMYNWTSPNVNDKYEWIYDKINQDIDKNGIVTKSIDYLGNKTSSKYNELGQVLFECAYCDTDSIIYIDFESELNEIAHTGNYSKTISSLSLDSICRLDMNTSSDYSIEFWYKNDPQSIFNPTIQIKSASNLSVLNNSNATEISVGEWTFYKDNFTPLSNGSHTILMMSTPSATIDDFLVKNEDAIIKKYVYNKDNFQLMSELDNEHFASFYHYDYQNRLSEVYTETYKGKKLLKQTSYNQPKIIVYNEEEASPGIQMINEELNSFERKAPNINPNQFKEHIKPKRINPNLLPNPRLPNENKGFNNKFEMLDFQLDKDGLEYEFFDIPKDSLQKLKNNIQNLDSLKKLNIENKIDLKNQLQDLNKLNGLDSLNKGDILNEVKVNSSYSIVDIENTMNLDSLKKIDYYINKDSLNTIIENEKKNQIQKQKNKNIEVNKEVRK